MNLSNGPYTININFSVKKHIITVNLEPYAYFICLNCRDSKRRMVVFNVKLINEC